MRGAFTHAGHTVTAELVFNERDELVDLVSDDRLAFTYRDLELDDIGYNVAQSEHPGGQVLSAAPTTPARGPVSMFMTAPPGTGSR